MLGDQGVAASGFSSTLYGSSPIVCKDLDKPECGLPASGGAFGCHECITDSDCTVGDKNICDYGNCVECDNPNTVDSDCSSSEPFCTSAKTCVECGPSSNQLLANSMCPVTGDESQTHCNTATNTCCPLGYNYIGGVCTPGTDKCDITKSPKDYLRYIAGNIQYCAPTCPMGYDYPCWVGVTWHNPLP